MSKITAVIKPFSLRQNFYVYENGNKIDSANPKIDEINDTIFLFMQKYNVDQLDLIGSKQFNSGLKKKIQEAEFTKFGKTALEINII